MQWAVALSWLPQSRSLKFASKLPPHDCLKVASSWLPFRNQKRPWPLCAPSPSSDPSLMEMHHFCRPDMKKSEPKMNFPQFSRGICTFEKNVKRQKIFCIKFFTKKIIMKIFVAIYLTKLQRSESTANVWRKHTMPQVRNLQPEADFRSPYGQNWRHIQIPG